MKVALVHRSVAAAIIGGVLLLSASTLALESSLRGLASSTHLASSSSSSSRASAFVQVHADAVFCVNGPACNGDAAFAPIGTSCPRKGDVAIDACMKGIASFAGGALGQCVAPADAECRVIPDTQTWGCVWPAELDTTSAAVAVASPPKTERIPPSQATTESTQAPPAATDAAAPPTPSMRVAIAAVELANTKSTAEASHSVLIVVVASAAGAVAVAAVVVVVVLATKRRRRRQTSKTSNDLQHVVITPDAARAVTPTLSSTVYIYTAQI